MPGVRLLSAPTGASPFGLAVLPALAFAGITLNVNGAMLVQAEVKVFSTLTDMLISRSVSDSQGRYTAFVIDASAYYGVAMQDGTVDSETLTADNANVTADRSQSVGGTTSNSVIGQS